MNNWKVVVFGLDCAVPRLVFKEWRKDLPHLSRLMMEGTFGPLRSCDPPITVPAWTSMLSGKNPAELGFYGFKNKRAGTYFEKDFVTADAVKCDRVWDILGKHGKKSILVGIPQTFPVYPVNGYMISGFLTPFQDSECTYPEDLRRELFEVAPEFVFDVADFRTKSKKEVLNALIRMTEAHFKVFRHLITTKPWDFACMVEIGLDRIQHCFWNDWDSSHPLYVENSEFQHAILDYYRLLDRKIGEILERLDKETTVLVVSDHGAKAMLGGIAINEWLLKKGYLKLKQDPEQSSPIEKCDVDWRGTTAWGVGGYFGRIYLNVEGREPEGIVKPNDYEKMRRKIADEVKNIPGVRNQTLATKVYTPEELYGSRTPNAPDLFVYFDDFNYRCLGSVGMGKVAHLENDIGPDGANHDYEGIFIAKGPGRLPLGGPIQGLQLVHVARTIVDCFGLDGNRLVGGKNLLESQKKSSLSQKDEEALEERLRSLGYLG